MRGTLAQQPREVIATRIERRRCAIYSIIMVVTEQTGQERKKAVKEGAREENKDENAKGREEEENRGTIRRIIRMAVPVKGLSY